MRSVLIATQWRQPRDHYSLRVTEDVSAIGGQEIYTRKLRCDRVSNAPDVNIETSASANHGARWLSLRNCLALILIVCVLLAVTLPAITIDCYRAADRVGPGGKPFGRCRLNRVVIAEV